jgi:drug/metabolite transporter (DMT)-like permease
LRVVDGRCIFSLVAINFLWGSNIVFIKVAADAITPLYMASFRFFLAASALYAYLYFKKCSFMPESGTRRLYLIISLLFTLHIGLFYVGAFKTSASHAVVLINAHIFFVALLAHFLLLHDRLGLLKTGGMIIAFLGVIAIALDPPGGAVNPPSLKGDLLILLSALILALQIVFVKKQIQKIDPVKVVFWEMLVGAVLTLLWGLALKEPFPDTYPPHLLLSLFYQGIIAGAFCFAAATALLKRYKASHMASFTVLASFFGVLCSYLYLGDQLTLYLIAGGILMVIGLMLTPTPNNTSSD